jgi:hypothetical protein
MNSMAQALGFQGAFLLIASIFHVFGRQDEAKQLARVEVVPGKLFVTVYAHALETRDGTIRCWSYVSEGMERYGQREIVFTLLRHREDSEKDFPTDFYGMFKTIYDFAEEGRLVPVGGFTVFSPGTRFLGREGRWGLMYLPAEMFKGVAIPPNALAAVLIKEDETDLIQKGLFYRISTSLGAAYRYYPFPAWSDPDRKPVITAAQAEKSTLSRIPLWRVRSVSVRVAAESMGPSLEPGAVPGDRRQTFGGVITVRINRDALPKIQSHLTNLSEGRPICLLTDPYALDSSRLCWFADSGKTIGIFPGTETSRWATGGFIILCHGEGIVDWGGILEDGFSMTLSPSSAKRLVNSLAAGLPVAIPAAGEGLSLAVEYSPALDPRRGLSQTSITLYNTDKDLVDRGFDAQTFSDYVDRLEIAASSVLADYAQLDARGLLVAVGVKPGGKVKVWCEALEGEMPEATLLRLKAELEKVPAIKVDKGPIAFALAETVGDKQVKDFPRIPSAWQKAADASNMSLSIPDELFKIIWPE